MQSLENVHKARQSANQDVKMSRVKDIEITTINLRIADSNQTLRESLQEIRSQEALLVAETASIEEILTRLNESSEAAQYIPEEKRAVQVQKDQLPSESPEDIEILAEIKVMIEGEVNMKLFEQHLSTFK